MTQRDQALWSVVRLLAVLTFAAGAFVVANPRPLAAGGEGTCAPATNAKCISSAGSVYDQKMCVGTQCVTCQPFEEHICTGFGEDVDDHYDSGGEN